MITCSVYIATSLDGFIARPDGDIDWLHNPVYTMPGSNEDFGYKQFMASGLPLFGEIGVEIPLRHQQTRSFANGFVQSHYQINKEEGRG